jgi:hypothetical protein
MMNTLKSLKKKLEDIRKSEARRDRLEVLNQMDEIPEGQVEKKGNFDILKKKQSSNPATSSNKLIASTSSTSIS